jgi:hypothetical protein
LDASAKNPYPFFKGVDKVKLKVSVSHDVTHQMERIGAPNFVVGEELKALTEKKLRDSGISTSGGSEEGPKLVVVSDVDMSNDEFTVTLSYYDSVSLTRDSSIKFETLLWTRKGHPQEDEATGLKATLTDLLDQFIAERIEADKVKN